MHIIGGIVLVSELGRAIAFPINPKFNTLVALGVVLVLKNLYIGKSTFHIPLL